MGQHHRLAAYRLGKLLRKLIKLTVAQKPSLSSLATDPLRNFVWQLTFTPGAASPSGAKSFTSGFMTVGGLGMTIDVIPYREGDHNTTTQKGI